MKTLIAAALVTLALASAVQAETSTLNGSKLPYWAQKALSPSA